MNDATIRYGMVIRPFLPLGALVGSSAERGLTATPSRPRRRRGSLSGPHLPRVRREPPG